jgi:hypothetical protein
MSKNQPHRFALVHEQEIIPGWRTIRHGRNHRASRTHAEERAERDEATYQPWPDDIDPQYEAMMADRPEEP